MRPGRSRRRLAAALTAVVLTQPTHGVLALASSYQWSKQYLDDFSGTADDINTYFDSGWRKLAETDFDYKFRYNERYTQLFSSHAVIYQKVTE